MPNKPETTNITEQKIHDRVEQLSEKEAIFCLRILLVAGRISLPTMEATLNLCDTVAHNV